MNNYLDLLKTPTTDPVQQKRQQLEEASAEKRSNLAGLDFYSIAAGVARGTGEASASTDELAMHNLSPAELRYRYGDEVGAQLTQQRGAGSFEYGRDRYATRTGAEAFQDTALGVGTGFANALAGIGALGAGLVSPTAGAAVSDWIQQGNEWASGFQSDALQRRSRANQAGTQLAYRDNALRQQQENDGDFVGSLKRIGRDSVSAVSGALDDGTIVGQGTAEGIGSLLAFGPISKGLRTIGSATMNLAGRTGVANVQGARAIAGAGATNTETMALGRAMADAANPSMIGAQGTARLMRGSDALRGPAAIAAMESGGTYSGTISEIMEMSHEDLLANSPVYGELLKTMDPEDAKIELATNAGLRAAAFVAPVAAATGALVSRFEAAPFRAPSIRQGLGNVLVREPAEEGVQSLAGSLASGEAIQTYADSTRDIAEGAGEELGLGALYGMTAAGTVQAPTLGGRAVYYGMRGIGKAAKGTGRFVINRFEEVESKTSKDSPISSQKVGEAVQAVSQEIGAVTETLNSAIEQGEGTPEQKQVERDFVSNINRAIQIAPEELDKLPQPVQEEIGNTNRRDLAVASIAARIPDLEEGSVEYMQAVTSLQELLEPVKSLQMADLRNLENTSNEQAQKVLNSIKWMLTQIDNTPEVRKAQEHISNITTPEKIQETIDRFGSDEAIRTLEGQIIAKAMASAITMNPGTGTREAAEILLRHSNSGALQLTNPQERAVRATLSLLVQHENFLTQQKALGLNRAQDVVSRQIISNTDDMSKTERGKLSLRQYTDRILAAMNSNNTEEATGWMEDLGMFVQHMNNKVNAVNQHYAEGNAKGITNLPKVKYQALNPDHTVEDPWYESPDGVHVSATNPNSVRLVQSMHLEGQTLADVYNGLVEALPELGLSPIEFNGLDPALLESAEQVASFAREAQRAARRPQTQTQPAKAQRAAPAKQEVTPTPKAKPVEATPVSRITQEQAQALSDEGLNKRIEAIQEKRSKKTNTPEDDATFKVLDEEMSRREDAAAREMEAEESGAQVTETARTTTKDGLTLEERRARNAERNKRVMEQRKKAQKQEQEEAPQEKPKLTLEERRARNKERNERVQKQREEAKQQQREEELETPVVEEATTPEPREEVDPSTLVPENDNTPERKGMVARFHDSLWKPLTNKLMDSFRLRPDIKDQPASRIAGHESPAAWVREALSSEENFREVLGKDPELALDEDIIDAYSVLLDNSGKIKMSVGNIKKIMERNLKEFLSRDAVKKAIANDQEANRWANGKALNITRPVFNAKGEEVGLEYNQELLEAAILAGVQWVLNGDQISRDLDADDFLRITGVEAHMISEAKKEAIASGLPADQVKIPIARLITQFWGLQPRKNADRAYSEGIPEAVAAEVVRALEETDFMDMLPTTIGPEEGLDKPKTLTTHRVNYDKINPQLGNYADAIQDAVLTEVQPSRFIGENTIPPVAKRQMNNPDVENTPAQQRAIKAANAIKYRVNLPMMHFLGAFGPEEMINLTGEVDPDWTVRNNNHIETLKGKALSYENSFKEVFSTIAEMRNRGQQAGIGLKNQVIRYAHNMSKVGRLQQLGRYNPQSSKLTREIILPTWSTLDLTNNADHQRAFHLALAQHLGIKIHRMPYEQAKREVLKKLKSEEAKPLMRAMREWLQNTDINSETLADNQMDGRDWHRLMKQAGFPPTFGAYHAVMEYARFMRARGKGRTEFETSLYLEADGVTNGPIMAMLMLTIGNFIGKGTRGFDWIGTVEKGGISFGSKKAMFSLDQVDLYQTAAANMAEPYKQLRAEFQQSGDEVVKVSDSLAIVMDALFDGDVRYNPDDNSVEIKRGITKNPLTITVYGSSPNGIAGSFVNRVVDEMYALQTKMASNVDNGMDPWTGLFENKEAMERFQQAMRDITNSKILWNKKQEKYFRTSVTNTHHKDRTSFTFTTDELDNMRNNFLVGFVEPMVEGITKTVGPGVMEASDLIRRATQIQSIYMEDAFRKAVNERLENRKKNDPSFKAGDFLSREDFEAIDAEISKKFPNVKTKTQTFRVTKRADVIGEKHPTYSRDFNDKMQTSPDVIAPGNSGVSGIAYLNIGFGDGNMIQVAIQNPALDRVLAVFDGINMPLDRINEISEIANKAVFEAGMGNPLQAVKEAFDTFLESVGPETELTERGWKDLARAVYGSSDADIEILKAEIGDIMTATKEQLDFAARSVHARHRALRDVGMSIDHMAGASTPFYQGPTHDLTKEQLAELLQSRYEKYMAEDGKVVEPKYSLKDRGALDEMNGTGASLFRWEAFKYLAKDLELSEGQTQVLNQVMSSLGATDFKVVAGTRQEILDYRVSRGMDPGVFGENDNGLISMSDRTIYLINPTGETFTHELVHAATMNILLAHYQGQDLGSNKVIIEGAVNRLEQMAEAFLLEDIDPALPAEVQQAMADAKAAMDNFLSEGMDPAVAQAGMLGEFIAWTLTNNNLMKELKQKPVNKFVKWARDVVEAIKELIWGKKKMPQPAEDVYSNILFNTGILMQAQKDVSATFQEMTQKHTSNNPRLESLRNTFRQLVLDSIKQAPPLDQKAAKWDKSQAITATQEVARKAAYAFGLSHLEESTLVSIASALTTVKDLDPQVMMGMQNMYRAVQDQLKVEDFNQDGQEDPWANEKYNIIMGRRDRFYNQDDVSNLLPVFVGLSMVSEDFRRVLANKTLPKTQSDHSSFDNWVGSLGYRGMEAVNNALTRQGNNRTVQGALDSMMDRLIQTVQDESTMMETVEKNTDRALSLNDHLRDALQHASRKVYEFGAHVENTSNNKVMQGAGRVVSVISSIVNEEKADIVADSVLVTGNRLKLGNAMMHLIKDFMGRTEATGGVYDLIKPIRAMVQQIRQQFRDNVPEIILKQFTNEPTEEQLTAMFQGMGRTDLAALVASGMSRSDVLNLLTDPRERRRLTRNLENQLRQLDPKHYNKLQDKMKQLANHMNGKGTGQILLRNAYAVANLWGVPNTSNRKAPSEDMIKLVDQLVSLYAFEDLSADVKTTLKTLVEDEAKGMDFVLAYLEGQRKTEVARSKLGRARANHYKGYIPSLPQKQGHLIVAEDKDFTNLRLSGYTRVGSYNGPSLGSTRVSMGYYYSSTPSRAAFAQGMMQNIVQSASGVERSTGFTMGHTAGRITNRRMVRKLVQRMHTDKGLTENLMPIFNDKGVIVAFERSIDPKYLQLLEPSQQIHSMLGVWRGRQIEEKLATEVNKTLLDKLYENWQQGQKDNLGDTYVNLLDPSVLDRVQQDAVDLFSDETLKYAQQLFGKGNLMVRADLLDDVTGYRNPTVGDFWTNNNRLSKETNETIKRMLIGFFGQDAYQKLVKAEQVVQGLVSDARTLIVVKSMVVPAINIISNVYQLIGRGVNAIQMARDFPKKLNEINTYVRTKLEQVELEAQIRAAGDDTRLKTKLHARIRSITDAHKRLSIWPLIQAGEFSTIADVGMSREDMKLSSGRVGEWMDAQVKKMPEGLQAAAKYGLVTKDTALFQGLQKSVQYGDFIAKAILYDHLTKKEKLTREQALARITEEFVNYDRLPGRVRSGLENMGMLWFYNFKLRSTKVGLSMLRNNPLHSLLVMGLPMPYGIGTPVDENVITKGLEGTLGYTLGPGMGLRAPTLNPWVNLLD